MPMAPAAAERCWILETAISPRRGGSRGRDLERRAALGVDRLSRAAELSLALAVEGLHALAEIVGSTQAAVAVTFELDRDAEGGVLRVLEQLLRRPLRQGREAAQFIDQRVGRRF